MLNRNSQKLVNMTTDIFDAIRILNICFLLPNAEYFLD
jgi:hypothetical protein